MNLLGRRRHAAPLSVLALIAVSTVLDAALGRGQVAYGLLVAVPLTAALLLGRRATASYGVLALVVAALLGAYNDQYSGEALTTQLTRLSGIVLGAVLAVGGATLRLRTEAQLATASATAAVTEEALRLTEVLQRSLLTDPPPIPGLQITVRYLPVTRHAQIGGDWYDAFPLSVGGTMLVIGDVAGHDAPAAATMAQARGMLRAIATTIVTTASTAASPAAVLTGVDRAFSALAMPDLTTAVVATLTSTSDGPAALLRWSNAGHPAPIVVCADGTTTVLERRPELLLGVDPDATRTNHQVALHPGETLLLYTDGLVERRGKNLDEGTTHLLAQLHGTHAQPLDQLCDRLLDGLTGRVDDDVAVLAVRVNPTTPASC